MLQYRQLEQEKTPRPKHVHACEVHIVAQSNSSATNLMSGDISGMLSLALSQQSSGALQNLQAVLIDVFQENLQICYEAPPLGPAAAHREEIYDLFLPLKQDSPHNQRNALRRYILSHTLNCDIASPDIVHCCGYGCCSSEQDTWVKFAKFTVWALIPTKTPKFARNRWLQQEEAVDWCALLGAHHGLLELVLTNGEAVPAPLFHLNLQMTWIFSLRLQTLPQFQSLLESRTSTLPLPRRLSLSCHRALKV